MYGLFPPASTSSARFVNGLSAGFSGRFGLCRPPAGRRLGAGVFAGLWRAFWGCAWGFFPNVRAAATATCATHRLPGRRLAAGTGRRDDGLVGFGKDAIDLGRHLRDRGHAVGCAKKTMITVM